MGRAEQRWEPWRPAVAMLAVAVIGIGGLAAPSSSGAVEVRSSASVVPSGEPPASPPVAGTHADYVVLYGEASTTGDARAAVTAAGGVVLSENAELGLAVVRSARPDFVAAAGAQPALAGAAPDRPTWRLAPGTDSAGPPTDVAVAGLVDSVAAADPSAPAPGPPGLAVPPTAEPLAALQWDMAMIGASDDGAFAVQRGSDQVLVGVVDTGIDASHPDLRGVVDVGLSRNFTRDDPAIDGPCEAEPDRSCDDPVDVDENGHGTHVAGTIGGALNGIGTAGVAPGVRLVNLRAGQDSGYFFLKPVLDAIVYAADHGVDVLNLSFFTDPWLFNCPANPADSPAEQVEQRTVVAATQRAVDYAWARGVTLVAALGNEHTDLARPGIDAVSPDLPPGSAKTRTIDRSCVKVPTGLDHVIGVVSVGPSGKKADYSNFGLGQADIAAPGGFFRDLAGTPDASRFGNEVLGPYPASVLEQDGVLDPTGRPRTPDVVQACTDGSCAYWRYLQGTSMAAPHVSGVAALIVSRAGRADPAQGGLTMDPADVEALLLATARPVACPAPVLSYAPEGRTSAYDARCDAGPGGNGLYGAGLVDAAAAVAAIPSGSTGLPGAPPLSRSSPAFASSGPSDLHH